MRRNLETGSYTFRLLEPVSCFCLLDSTGATYHVRELPASSYNGQGQYVNINIAHPDTYYASCNYDIVSSEPLKGTGEDIDLPTAERFRARPIKVQFNPSLAGTPARIFTMANPALIEVGSKFYTYPKQVRLFILLHEYGHLFYKTEWKVDLFALRSFLQMGYNASQAFYALSKVLGAGEQNEDRINRLFNSLKDNNSVS